MILGTPVLYCVDMINKSHVGNIGMFEIALRLSRQGKRITVHGGTCAFDMSDGDGDRYEIKTARACIKKGGYKRGDYRGWGFCSGNNKNIAKFEYTIYVLLTENAEFENAYIIPKEKDRFRNGKSATIKDTNHQKANSNRPDLVTGKWYDEFIMY